MNATDMPLIRPGMLRPNLQSGGDSPEPARDRFDLSASGTARPVVSAAFVSVLVCSHNPKPAYLDRVLNALQHQTLDSDKWELLLVDSASEEPLVQRFDLRWHPRALHLREDQPGKTRAFLRGLAACTAPILVIVDDDNMLAPDYLQQTVRIAEAHPNLGAWGGNIVLQFEAPPPEWTRHYWTFLAQQSVAEPAMTCNLELCQPMPVGAGCCVRRQVAERYANQMSHSPWRGRLGPTANHLWRCEDTDLVLTACEAGLQRGLMPSLRLDHLIPPERLTEEYLLRLTEGLRFSSYVLEMSREPGKAPPAINWWWRLRFACDCLVKFGRKRRFYLANKRAQKAARILYEAESRILTQRRKDAEAQRV